MSRPRLSRPSQYSALGGAQTSPTGVDSPKGAMTGASTAPRRLITTIVSPIKAAMEKRWPKRRMGGSARVPQPRIAEDAQQIRDHVEQDIGAGEDQAAGLHHRHVPLGDGIDHELAPAPIDQDHLHHHPS